MQNFQGIVGIITYDYVGWGLNHCNYFYILYVFIYLMLSFTSFFSKSALFIHPRIPYTILLHFYISMFLQIRQFYKKIVAIT